MRIYKCDICGQETSENDLYIAEIRFNEVVSFAHAAGNTNPLLSQADRYELCKKHGMLIRDFIDKLKAD